MRDDQFVKIAKALADPARRRILRELRAGGELTCSCVCACVELSQPTVSHHIKTLVDAGIIDARRDGPYHRLTVNEGVLREFAQDVGGPGVPRPRKPAPRKAGEAKARAGRTRARPPTRPTG